MNERDAQTSTEDLLDEYSGIVMLTSRPEHALRVNEIIEEGFPVSLLLGLECLTRETPD